MMVPCRTTQPDQTSRNIGDTPKVMLVSSEQATSFHTLRHRICELNVIINVLTDRCTIFVVLQLEFGDFKTASESGSSHLLLKQAVDNFFPVCYRSRSSDDMK